ncbi:serine/threonine protein kinase [Mycobacteroides sp. H001]|nr:MULTISPECIES: protein kinase [Mycobacteroides]KRQ22448.1 serine/threonine protein kinase [Mycobacteroides sp. H003]KRQ25237.1 serine/threonine protein kinase [Mycobacteroides sp. H072]KRQ27757.1 serine/threonine protein kinase [Mycobacteroides sp. H092]KRQ40920.1 serine/threonine protein kinase [Mycobacteroides sp. H101]KRQ41144.1 serine/threonine protein kinase [Mycobacteroides sp. H002]
MIGTVLDSRYRIEAPIATGGMSTVYRGLDTRLDRPVAVKVMDSRYASDTGFLARFRLEARAVARLRHPGLVAVFDQGMDGKHPFLVMELIDGGTLRELLRERGPMPPHAVAAVFNPLLGGLAVAHRSGLVHRDVKPENVLISDDGEVKLADFGLVRAVAEAGITSTSVILGTAAYLSPEQVRTGSAGPRSDVYSAGILMYELLTGSTPFTGDTPLALAYQRIDRDVQAPSEAIDGIPEEFDELVLRATSRDPDARYADAAQMGAELDAIAADLQLPTFRVPAPRDSKQHVAEQLYRSRLIETGGRTTGNLSAPGKTDAADTASAAAALGVSPRPSVSARPKVPNPTRMMDPVPAYDPQYDPEFDSDPDESAFFADIDDSEYRYERQQSRRAIFMWLVIVLIITTSVAAGCWSLGANITNLL